MTRQALGVAGARLAIIKLAAIICYVCFTVTVIVFAVVTVVVGTSFSYIITITIAIASYTV